MTFQVDFVNPINDSTKFEFGVRSNGNLRAQENFFSSKKGNQDFVPDPNISLDADILDMVNGIYFNYASRLKNGISYQVGLRYEQSKLEGKSKVAGVPTFGYDYYALDKALFPSVYLSKKLDKTSEIQLNFSRKIQRPNFMQLMPVIQNNDRQNIRIGNPKLQPKIVNLSELNYNKQFGNNNWLISAYFMLESNTITLQVWASTPVVINSEVVAITGYFSSGLIKLSSSLLPSSLSPVICMMYL